jgi:ribose transport system permease protein
MNILQQSSINACIALGMTLVIISGGIDLSVGPVAALSAVLGAAMMVAGVPVPLAVARCLGWARLVASSTGSLIAWGGLQPFIVTLGGLSLFRAFALIYTGGTPIFGIPTEFRDFTNGKLAGIPNPVLIVVVLAALAWVILNRTPPWANT